MINWESTYNKIVEELRGNLTNKEYRELIALEYVLTWGYNEPGDEEKYIKLSNKKHYE